MIPGHGKNAPLLIAGGGIGGLSAALALLRQGVQVRVLEQASVLREVGAGVQISPNGSRVLDALGVLDRVRANAVETSGKEVRMWNTGETWKLFDLGSHAVERFGYPYFTVYRVDLHNALIDAVQALAPHAIELGRRVAGVTQDAHGVEVSLHDGEHVRGSALVGADGIHSHVRTALFGTGAATFGEIVVWRSVVPMDQVPDHLRRPVATNWIGPGGHVIHYPLRRGELMNFVGYLERSGWAEESWNVQGTAAECEADFSGWHEDVRALARAGATPFKWGLARRPVLDGWTAGRVTLLGDACHAMYPFLAQGAVMSLEDGLVLARCVAAQPDAPDAAFARYEAARIERTSRVVEGSADNVRRFHNPLLADAEQGRAYVEREWATQRISDRYDWIFDYDAATVPLPPQENAQ